MKNKNSNALMLISGIVAGAATMYFLKSDKGKEIIDLVLEKGDEVKNKVVSQSKIAIQEGKKVLEEAIEQSNETLSDVKNTINTAAGDLKETAETKVDNFQNGIKLAKKELQKA